VSVGEISGIDEAGRDCLAGPLCVAGCVLQREIAGLADSKKLSEKRREELYAVITKNSRYKIIEISSAQVDEAGLSSCLRSALEQILAYFMGFSGQIIYDVAHEEKQRLTVADLLQKFEEVSGGELTNDRMLLSEA